MSDPASSPSDIEANHPSSSHPWWRSVFRQRQLLDERDKEQFLFEGWERNKWVIHMFATIVLIHSIYVNVVYSAVYNTTPYRNGIVYGILYPVSLAVLLMSFFNPLSHPIVRVIWYMLLSIEGIMMTVQISIKDLLCYYKLEVASSCDIRYKPLAELQWVYAIVGPLLILTMMRNYRPTQLVASLFMFTLVIWSVATGNNLAASQFIQWSEVGFAVGANVLALVVVGQRESDEQNIFVKRTANERLQQNLLAEITARTVAQRKAMLEEEKRNQFTSYIFHEIRNPLNTIILSMELLDIDEEFHRALNASMSENMSRIKVALISIESIINDTLDLRKMNEGKLSLNPRPFDFHRMIHTCVWTMESVWKEKKVSMKIQLDEQISLLPQLIGDETRLHQVLTNYLSNAVKFTPINGTITLSTVLNTVTPLVASGAVTITVTVSDTGIGISEDNQKKLFHEFVQIDPEKNQGGKGTGLGLSICAGIIKSMNGEYGVRSQPNMGSSFFFRVAFPLSNKPIVTNGNDELPAKPLKENVKDKDKDNNHNINRAFKLLILVTDDDPTQRKIMTQLLSRIGHSVDTAVDGVDCLEKVAISIALNKQYDVLFVDNQMPRLTGGDAIRVLRESGVSTHIISLTATADTDLHDDLRKAGASEILTKPSSKALIDKALRMLPFPDKLPPIVS